MYFDTHAHYDDEQFDGDREELLSALPNSGISLVVNAASSLPSSKKAIALAETHPFLYAAAGVHPHEAAQMGDDTVETLEKLLKTPKVVAVGEIGLDYHYDFSPREIQKVRFRQQMELAGRAKKPVIIHEREATEDCLTIVRAFPGVSGVFHCFSGSWETAKIILDMGWYLSFAGVITFKNARKAIEVLEKMPQDRILIETDCPYLAPVPHRGKRNSSLNLPTIAEKVAEIRKITLGEAANLTMNNGRRFFWNLNGMISGARGRAEPGAFFDRNKIFIKCLQFVRNLVQFSFYTGQDKRNKGEESLIEVRDLVKKYGGHMAVDHLSFTVEKGQVYGFLGPNGAGKTTTMNVMTGYIGATEGVVVINGHDISEEPEEARRCIGYLPEQPPLYTDMTVLEYLDFAAELKGLAEEEREREVQNVMELTGIADVQSRLIRNLSKGYRQRVGLAQALLGFPDVLILDEPTVGLDPKQIIEIRDLIRSLKGEHTIILSSHILSEVQEICDHVMIIHHGKLVASGTPEELERQLNTSSLELTVKADREETVKNALKKIPDVSNVTCAKKSDSGEITVVIETGSNGDLREAVYFACSQANLPIFMMKAVELSLEQIFLEITDDGKEKTCSSEKAKPEKKEAGQK